MSNFDTKHIVAMQGSEYSEMRKVKNSSDWKETYRPYLLPSGDVKQVLVEWCRCGDKRRGPSGGVCGNCGGAIPSEREIDSGAPPSVIHKVSK